jgi:hypothetical protein
LAGTVIDLQASLGLQRMGQPAFSMTKGLGVGMKNRSSAPASQHGFQHLLIATIRQMHGDSARGGNPSSREFGGHPPRSPTTSVSCTLFKGLQVCWVMDVRNRASRGVTARISGVQAIDIGQQNQIIRINRCCNEG